MAQQLTYTARYERDEDGTWIVRLKGIQGVHSNGRSIEEARRRVREALAAALDDDEAAEAAELIDDIALPRAAKTMVARHTRAREAAEKARRAADSTQAEAAAVLTNEGLSLADTGLLLGVSRQRVHQLVSK